MTEVELSKELRDAMHIKIVRDHALEHYEEDGWDFIVEATSDEQLIEMFADAQNPIDAIARVKEYTTTWAAYRSEPPSY